MKRRPSFHVAATRFQEVNKSVSKVGKIIGGKVDYNINDYSIEEDRFKNACAIRISYVLNKTGFEIQKDINNTVSGSDGKWYIYRVRELLKVLEQKFGKPDVISGMNSESKISGKKGILIFDVSGWDNATGHATLWNGITCLDSCYFNRVSKFYLWELKSY